MKKSFKKVGQSLKPKKRREDMTNFEKIESTDSYNTAKHRDVFGTQQLDRGELRKVEGPRSRIILNVFLSFLVFLFSWFTLSLIDLGISSFTSFMSGSNPMSHLSGGSNSSGGSSGNNSSSSSSDDPSMSYSTNESLPKEYWLKSSTTDKKTLEQVDVYYQVDSQGRISDPTKEYKTQAEVPVPDWWVNSHGRNVTIHSPNVSSDSQTSDSSPSSDSKSSDKVDNDGSSSDSHEKQTIMSAKKQGLGLLGALLTFRLWKFLLSLLISLAFFAFFHQILMRNLDAQNAGSTTEDINQYKNDSHIALPEEIQRQFDYFPDVGAHSNVQVSSMISHVMLSNKGINKIMVSRRADKDIYDENGDIVYYKGEALKDSDGNFIMDEVSLFDKKFGDDLFEASGALNDKRVRKYYDTTIIPYNPGDKNRDKLKGFNTVADLINNDWSFPSYEVQRPAGVYLVDTAPVNTLVVAMTRAGKGQTLIIPTVDMWTREKKPNNMFLNDPKGGATCSVLKRYRCVA